MSDYFICRNFIPITRHDKCHCALVSLKPFFEYNEPQTWSELVSTVANNNLERLQNLMRDNSAFRVADRHGNSPLHLSVIFQKYEIFNYLLNVGGINLDAVNRYGQTSLHLAVINEDEFCVNELIKKGCEVNFSDTSCCTPLHASATRYHPKISKILLDSGADLNFQNLLGKTALYHACQYGTLDCVYFLLYYGADTRIPDVYGVLPLTAAMLQSMNCDGEIPQSHLELQEILFNYTFERKKILVNLSLLTVAMKMSSHLFPKILKKVGEVRYSRHDLSELGRSLIVIREDYFKMFVKQYSHILREVLLSPADLHYKLNLGQNVDQVLVQFMDFVTMLFKFRPSLNFIKGSMNFTYFITILVSLLKQKKISYDKFKQAFYFVYSHGLPCELVHIITIYENLGFCDILKFLLDFDIVVTLERPKAVMPYLICDLNLTIDKFIKIVKIPSKKYIPALKFFASQKVRNFLQPFVGKTTPELPSLVELAREATRKHIIKVFKIKRTKDFYRLVEKLPVNDIYKRIITYEKELYQL